jgi:hypothetical protein
VFRRIQRVTSSSRRLSFGISGQASTDKQPRRATRTRRIVSPATGRRIKFKGICCCCSQSLFS